MEVELQAFGGVEIELRSYTVKRVHCFVFAADTAYESHFVVNMRCGIYELWFRPCIAALT